MILLKTKEKKKNLNCFKVNIFNNNYFHFEKLPEWSFYYCKEKLISCGKYCNLLLHSAIIIKKNDI